MSLFAGREGARNEFGYQRVQILKNEQLGVGAYGSVCRARLDQLVCAAKVLHQALFSMQDPGTHHALERFRSECEILSRMRHPNIVQYIGTATDPESRLPVLLMEMLDCSLTSYLERDATILSYHLLINFSHDISMAVAYLHSNGILHRDLSSNNVLLLAGVRAKVTDFGMSNLLSHLNRSRITKCPGSPNYMAPEAVAEPPVYNEKIDIFSMGVLFIQMMTKRFPDPGPAVRRLDNSHFEEVYSF